MDVGKKTMRHFDVRRGEGNADDYVERGGNFSRREMEERKMTAQIKPMYQASRHDEVRLCCFYRGESSH